MNKIGERLKEERLKKGWTKTYIYQLLGLGSMQTYANWEYGRALPDAKNIAKLATLFGVTTDYLIGHSPTPTEEKVETDLDKLIDNAHSYDGKPITGHDRDLIKAYLQGLYADK